ETTVETATMLMPTEATMETTTMRTTATTTTPTTETTTTTTTTTTTEVTTKPPMPLPPPTTRAWLAPTDPEPVPVKLTDNAPSTAPLPSSRDSVVS
ncbi:unnamed protein product, partial [Colletotrichum noveboracense]